VVLSTLLCELGLLGVATGLIQEQQLAAGDTVRVQLIESRLATQWIVGTVDGADDTALTLARDSERVVMRWSEIGQLQRLVGVHKHPVRGALLGAVIAVVAGTTINAAAGTAYQVDCETLCGPGGIEIAELATVAVVGAVVGLVVDAVGDNREWKVLPIPVSRVPP